MPSGADFGENVPSLDEYNQRFTQAMERELDNCIQRGEYREAQPRVLMMRPCGRVVAPHVTIIAGGGLAMALGWPLWALLLLLVIKTAMDARAHLREHGRSESGVGVRESGVA